jgi:hypothetical protein
MYRTVKGGRGVGPAVALLLLLGAAGCEAGGKLYPVGGNVTLDDGKPLTKGVVIFERTEGGPPVTARGEIKPDGSYQLSTYRPGDGVPPGKYRVLINPLDLSEVPDEEKQLPFDAKYLKFETSGLEYEVRPGSNNGFSFRLGRPKEKDEPKADRPKESPQ